MNQPTVLPVLARSERWVVVDKPSGMVIHPSHYSGQFRDTVVQVAARQFGCSVHAVHRLDAATSGALLLAFDAETVAALARQFLQREVRKRYLAVVRGWPAESGIIEHELEDERGRRLPARTEWRLLAQAEFPWPIRHFAGSRYALLEAVPLQGRRHQLRRHFKSISHPLIGDSRYGKGDHNRLFRLHLHSHRLLLHASCLEFVGDGRRQSISAPIPADLASVLAAPQWSWRAPAPEFTAGAISGSPEAA